MEWKTSNEGIFIGGETQNGKSVFANWLAFTLADRISIFWNDDKEPFVKGKKATSLRELGRLIDEDVRMIDYHPPGWAADDLQEHYGKIVKLLFELNDPHEYDTGFVLVTDEAQEIGGTGSPVYRMAKRGEKRGIKNVIISQTFQAISKDVVRQCSYKVWIGPPDPAFDRQYFEDKRLPFDALQELDEREAAVIDGSDVIDTLTVPSKFATS